MLEIIAQLFSDIMTPGAEVPEAWKKTRIKVLFKSDDPQLAKNYRPISVLSVLYKLFSRVLYGRIQKHLLEQQSVDQAGFRTGFGCDDHLFAVTMVAEISNEWRMPLWVAAVDFQKAFDSVLHTSIWQALADQEVPMTYVHMLRRLYEGQKAEVQTDKCSREFGLRRGTKQGDPISPALFNAALEGVFRRLKPKWERKGWGLQLRHGRRHLLQNLRFADDVLLLGRTIGQIKGMLGDLMSEAGKAGLKLHFGKTKILNNGFGRASSISTIEVAGQQVEVVGDGCATKYLGRALSLTDPHDVELDNRLARGWAKFAVFKDELTNKCYPLEQRMRLFGSVITPTVLYGSCAWAMTVEREGKLRGAQRRMVRKILGKGRQRAAPAQGGSESGEESTDTAGESDQEEEEVMESWVDWMRRTTGEAEAAMKAVGVTDWVAEQRRRKWRWAGHVLRRTDGRWTRKVLDWRPDGVRRQGRPVTRWTDSLANYLGQCMVGFDDVASWEVLAADKEGWEACTEDFCSSLW